MHFFLLYFSFFSISIDFCTGDAEREYCILISLDAVEEDGFKGMLTFICRSLCLNLTSTEIVIVEWIFRLRKSPFHCTRKLHLSSFSLHNVDIHRDLQRPINLKSDPREYTEME
uniref:Secreted protein n=1 Tax=Strongyloides venezuelensis TaxID=75913 RepID=A0A0K0G5C1_STRVS